MSRSRNSRKGSKAGHRGREYWSRRPCRGRWWGRIAKRFTHALERRAKRRIEREALDALKLGPSGPTT